MSTHRYNQEADQELDDLYTSVGAETIQEKINALSLRLGDSYNFYAFGGDLTDDMKLGSLEYEYLGAKGLIEVIML